MTSKKDAQSYEVAALYDGWSSKILAVSYNYHWFFCYYFSSTFRFFVIVCRFFFCFKNHFCVACVSKKIKINGIFTLHFIHTQSKAISIPRNCVDAMLSHWWFFWFGSLLIVIAAAVVVTLTAGFICWYYLLFFRYFISLLSFSESLVFVDFAIGSVY